MVYGYKGYESNLFYLIKMTYSVKYVLKKLTYSIKNILKILTNSINNILKILTYSKTMQKKKNHFLLNLRYIFNIIGSILLINGLLTISYSPTNSVYVPPIFLLYSCIPL